MTPDPLLTPSALHSYWTITNLTEAFPGVLTPLGWSIIGAACELGNRRAFRSIGALREDELGIPARPEDRAYGCFYGRAAIRVDWLARISDRIPGVTGAMVTEQFMGLVPPVVENLRETNRRYGVIAAKYPATVARVPRMVTASRVRSEAAWQEAQRRIPSMELAEARSTLLAGHRAVVDAVGVDATKLLAGVQPMYEGLIKLAGSAGFDPAPLEAAHGSHEETALVADLWNCSRGKLDFETVVARHGFHGPHEGEVAARVWREDPEPLRRICESYRAMPEDADPLRAEIARAERRRAAERELLAALPAAKRAGARLLLRLVHIYLPLRGKAARLQGLDIARAAARRYGDLLAHSGVLEDPSDIFYLTIEETQVLPTDLRELVAGRRARWQAHHEVDVPMHWEGMPTPIPVRDRPVQRSEADAVSGLGAGAGVVEGRVCVVTDPNVDDMEPGDVLVARTTDPSWASIMFLASALVVDIGGMLSHAAVVARELELPCVMGTGDGTAVLRTGDRVRVDGGTGQVQILSRATA